MARSRVLDATSGLLAAAVALGVAELVTTAIGIPSMIVSVGDIVVDYTPGDIVKAAIDQLGTNDKPALLLSVVVVSLAIGVVVGPLAGRYLWTGAVVLGVFGLVGAFAGARDPQVSFAEAIVVAALAASAGFATLTILLRAASPDEAAPAGATMPGAGVVDRRRFLGFAAGAAGAAVGAAFVGPRILGPTVDIEEERRSVTLPTVGTVTAASQPIGLDVPDLSSLITPNDEFYRIDTALATPRIDVEGWRLRIKGMVDRPYELTFEELTALGAIEETVTLACVSNKVGGDLVGNAVWRGIPLQTILDRAGVQAGATQVVARSVDGFTVGFPTEVALDGRPSMVAVGMNGEPLPARHGFPARTIVPGLYGYVSATKWLEELELTTLDAFDAYWVPRGWAKQAPIKTQSRIDVPRGGSELAAGPARVAGVAWGGIRSVSRVEVRITPTGGDAGEWLEATLGDALSQSTWRQWVLDWDAQPGAYRIEVRATDGEGNVQTAEHSDPPPDGATGHHQIGVRVS